MTGELAELIVRAVLIGAGGAALMDVWGVAVRRLFGIRGLDYALLGRWIGHMARGRFFHQRIAAAEPIGGELALGWFAHYSIGIVFALPLLTIWGPTWARSPSLWPALMVGMVTIVAPWFVLQPAMGLGVAASRAPNPWSARFRNVMTHVVYGLGLYLSAAALNLASP
jgi:hypothetical protein